MVLEDVVNLGHSTGRQIPKLPQLSIANSGTASPQTLALICCD